MKCEVLNCERIAPFYWNKPSGTIHLCSDHYDAMEREVHEKEKANRLIAMTMEVIIELIAIPQDFTFGISNKSNTWDYVNLSDCLISLFIYEN